MKLEALEKAASTAREQARRLEQEARQAGGSARAAKDKARQAKAKLKLAKREAKQSRRAAKEAKYAFAEAQFAAEKADAKAGSLEKKMQKLRKKSSQAHVSMRKPKPAPAHKRKKCRSCAKKAPKLTPARGSSSMSPLINALSPSRLPLHPSLLPPSLDRGLSFASSLRASRFSRLHWVRKPTSKCHANLRFRQPRTNPRATFTHRRALTRAVNDIELERFFSSLLCPLPKSAAHAVPERFQIRLINGRTLYGVLVDGHRFFEPRCAVLQPPQLGAVAGQVVRDQPDLGEPLLDRG